MGEMLDFSHFSLPDLALDDFPVPLTSTVWPLPTQTPTCADTQTQKQPIYPKNN